MISGGEYICDAVNSVLMVISAAVVMMKTVGSNIALSSSKLSPYDR